MHEDYHHIAFVLHEEHHIALNASSLVPSSSSSSISSAMGTELLVMSISLFAELVRCADLQHHRFYNKRKKIKTRS